MNLKKPVFWDNPKQSIISNLLIPFTLPIILRNFFTKFIKKEKSTKIKTICVGNIYIGGTGKTPLTIKLYEILNKLGYKVATAKKYHSNQFDEQILLKKKTKTIISKSRKIALTNGINSNYEILIFDDGLQDSQLDYDLKFVCFKSENWIGNGQIIPAGPLRENIISLTKFDAVFLNGSSNKLEEIEKTIKKINSKLQIFRTHYNILNNQDFDKNKDYLLFSGIGSPEDFKKILLNNNFKIKNEFIFPDHYRYNNKDFEKILNFARMNNLNIITTEKDYVKVPEKFQKNINYIKIKLNINKEEDLINLLTK